MKKGRKQDESETDKTRNQKTKRIPTAALYEYLLWAPHILNTESTKLPRTLTN
jgi:hypothetical protein